MNQKEQLSFLERMLEETVKQRLQGEYQYRLASSQQMALGNGEKQEGERMMAIMQGARKQNEMLEAQARQIKSLIGEIKDGEFELSI